MNNHRKTSWSNYSHLKRHHNSKALHIRLSRRRI
ncbi:MAG: hypothetical protein ACR2NI_06385 [Pirellulales bacterium]